MAADIFASLRIFHNHSSITGWLSSSFPNPAKSCTAFAWDDISVLLMVLRAHLLDSYTFKAAGWAQLNVLSYLFSSDSHQFLSMVSVPWHKLRLNHSSPTLLTMSSRLQHMEYTVLTSYHMQSRSVCQHSLHHSTRRMAGAVLPHGGYAIQSSSGFWLVNTLFHDRQTMSMLAAINLQFQGAVPAHNRMSMVWSMMLQSGLLFVRQLSASVCRHATCLPVSWARLPITRCSYCATSRWVTVLFSLWPNMI